MISSTEQTINQVTNYLEANKVSEAKELLEKAVKVNPRQHHLLFLFGITLRKLGNNSEAIQSFEKSLAINSNQEAVWGELGQSFVLNRMYDKAVEAFKKSLSIKPNYQSSANLGDVYLVLGKFAEAINFYNAALKFTNQDFMVYRGLGEAYYKLNDLQNAFDNFLASLRLNPNQAKINYILAKILLNAGYTSKSIEFFKNEINLGTNIPEAYLVCGETLQQLGRVSEGVEYYKAGLRLRPFKDGYSTLMHIIHHDPRATNADFKELTAECYRLCLKPFKDSVKKNYSDFSKRNKDPKKKLKVGFFSYRFRFAAADYWALKTFQNFNKNDIEIVLYHDSNFSDHGTEEFKNVADQWKDVHGLSHEQVAQIINDDEIDILVDMIGHMGGGRLELFTLKPAPIQVCWLNYYGTLGMPEMDYFIADKSVVTEESEKYFVEKVHRMPNMFNPFTPKGLTVDGTVADSIPYRKNGFITFGLMCRFAKINTGVLEYLVKILKSVENSKLYFAAEAFKDMDLKEQTLAYFQNQGVDKSRIQMETYPALKEFFLKFNEFDICLDTFPFAGGATTLDTVFMGVPTVTIAGNTWVSRSGIAVHSNINCPELIADSVEDCINKVVELANAPERLDKYKKELRTKLLSSQICNQEQYAKDFSQGLRSFWETYCMTRKISFQVEDKFIEYELSGDTVYGHDYALLDKEIDLTANTDFRDQGFKVLDLLDAEAHKQIQEGCKKIIYDDIKQIKDISVSLEKFRLEDYHKYVDDETHLLLAKKYGAGFDEELFPIDFSLIEKEISNIVGTQVSSYLDKIKKKFIMLRIIRPLKSENNPPHRDPWLDVLKNTINVYFPLAGSSIDSSLPVMPGSHRWKESEIERTVNGAQINGLSYNVPAVVGSTREIKMIRPQPLANQAMIFSPYLIHGGGFNFQTDTTRVSLEMRFWKI